MLPTLIIHLGATNSYAFLFATDGQKWHCLETQIELTLKDPLLTIEHFKASFLGRFEGFTVISSRQLPIICQPEELIFEKGASFFSQLGEALVIDIGSEKVALARARFGKTNCQKIGLGLGVNAGKILRQVKVEELAQLIPNDVSLIDIQNYLGKKTLYPGLIPNSLEELFIEVAHASLILSEAKKAANLKFLDRVPQFILLTGACFSRAPNFSLPLFTFLQGWQPTGVNEIFVDESGLFYPWTCQAGAEAFLEPFKKLGTLISLTHKFEKGSSLGELTLDLGVDEKLKIKLKAGELFCVPFREGGQGTLEISLKRGVFLGESFAVQTEIDGGELGIVVDARGRPLSSPHLSKEGRELVKGWQEKLGG